MKQRVEALGGRVWVESGFGDGSTFFVSLPRISDAEYEKMRIAYENEQMIRNFAAAEQAQAVQAAVQAAPEVQAVIGTASVGAGPASTAAPVTAQPSIVARKPMAQSDPTVGANEGVLQPQAVIQPQATETGGGAMATNAVSQSTQVPHSLQPQVSQAQPQINNPNEETA